MIIKKNILFTSTITSIISKYNISQQQHNVIAKTIKLQLQADMNRGQAPPA